MKFSFLKNISYYDFIGLLISLLFLGIVLPSEIYHGPKVVFATYTCSLLTLLVIGNLFKGIPPTNSNSFPPVISIACILSAIFSGIGFHLNVQDGKYTKNNSYIPKYQVYVKSTDCHEKKSSRRSVIPNLCSFNIQSIDSGVGSIIREFYPKESEFDCLRFDINKGKLGLSYANNVISCDDINNRKRLQKYRQSF